MEKYIQGINAILSKIANSQVNVKLFTKNFLKQQKEIYNDNYLSTLSIDDIILDAIRDYIYFISQKKDIELLRTLIANLSKRLSILERGQPYDATNRLSQEEVTKDMRFSYSLRKSADRIRDLSD